MTKIEYVENETDPSLSGWWILDFEKLGDEPYGRTGPFATRLRALEIWRDSTPDRKTDSPEKETKKEPTNAPE
jgi:hypothetical protein